MVYKILIVCRADGRAETLARLLANDKLEVFSIIEGKIAIFKNDWQATATSPNKYECLFFHINDFHLIPKDIFFKFEFAFSGASLDEVPKGINRPAAKPINEPFLVSKETYITSNSCPVKKHHIPELIQLLSGSEKTLPDFCKKISVSTSRLALRILCQSAVLIMATKDDTGIDSEILQEIGWDILPKQTQNLFQSRFKKFEEEIFTAIWWAKALGFESSKVENESNQINEKSFNSFQNALVNEYSNSGLTIPEEVKKFLEKIRTNQSIKPEIIREIWSSLKNVQ